MTATDFSPALTLVEAWPVDHRAAAVIGADGVLAQNGDEDRVFRLASISKVMTAYACLIAVEEESIALDDAAGPPGATVRHLLSHASGYGFESGAPVLAKPGKRRIYSNHGFEVLADFVADATDIPFDEYLHEGVFAPLHMTSARLDGSAAADVSASLADVARFARELLRPTLISGETHRAMISVQFPDLAGVLPGFGSFDPLPWGLGVEIKGERATHWSGSRTSPRTFGHFGGSGTFLWVDPERDLALTALTDRNFGDWSLQHWPVLGDAVLSAGD